MELMALRRYTDRPGCTLRSTAAELGVSERVLWAWITRGQVSIEKVIEIEKKTGISRIHLRPFDWFLIWPEYRKARGKTPAPDPQDG